MSEYEKFQTMSSSPASQLVDNSSALAITGMSFRYVNSENFVLKDVIKIPMGSKVAFVGGSGSGKSTLLDVLMGLPAT